MESVTEPNFGWEKKDLGLKCSVMWIELEDLCDFLSHDQAMFQLKKYRTILKSFKMMQHL